MVAIHLKSLRSSPQIEKATEAICKSIAVKIGDPSRIEAVKQVISNSGKKIIKASKSHAKRPRITLKERLATAKPKYGRFHFKTAKEMGVLVDGVIPRNWITVQAASSNAGVSTGTIRNRAVEKRLAMCRHGRSAYVSIETLKKVYPKIAWDT